MTTQLLIIGASARAAAFSALRAGLTPRCADLFADIDLARCAEVQRVAGPVYPLAFRNIVQAHSGPWLYTGALENHPKLIGELARLRPLWGNDEAALAACRYPERWTYVLQAAWVPCPRIAFKWDEALLPQRWLIKPLQSAGGVRIRFYQGEPLPASVYLQEYIEGLSCSALYLGAGGQARLLGVTRQLVGEAWLHAGPFRYCGSIGPLSLDAELRQRFERLGQVLAVACGLRGLFGVDVVLAEGVPWPVEINPRYTASVEVLEYATGLPALSLHQAVFDPDARPPVASIQHGEGAMVGKAILFAASDFIFPGDGPWLKALDGDPWTLPAFADIPAAGTPIRLGQPILTILVRGGDEPACQANLRQAVAEVDRMFGG